MSSPAHIRNLPALFLVVAAVLLLVLIGLGWTTLQLDRELSQQRTRDRLNSTATTLADGFQAVLEENETLLKIALQSALTDISDLPPTGKILVSIQDDSFLAYPVSSLRYKPIKKARPTVHSELARSDQLELSDGDLSAAAAVLRPLIETSNTLVQAAALMRIARIEKKRGDIPSALLYYDRLGRLAQTSVGGIPAPWLVLYSRCRIFEETQQFDSLKTSTILLGESLRSGGFEVDRQTYQYYVLAATEWSVLASSEEPASNSIDIVSVHPLSEASISIQVVYDGWQAGRENSSGIRFVETMGQNILIQWLGSGNRLIGILMDEIQLRDEIGSTVSNSALASWHLADGAGRIVLKNAETRGSLQSTYSFQTADRTWALHVSGALEGSDSARERTRRILLLVGLFVASALVAVSTYFVARALRRELAFSQLQTEFVSAVSHEFKTPLTSIRQLTEMLRSGRIRSDDRIESYYEVLDREARRLNRLVESLLNFGRTEAGLQPYELKSTSVNELVESTVTEYNLEQHEPGQITLLLQEDALARLDRSTMMLVLWNLIDNARKYSSKEAEILIRTQLETGFVRISVRDQGTGIAPEDQKRIFEKFVRVGDVSVRGTGIGLALVKRIVEDHGGTVGVESRIGSGSEFHVRLPVTTVEVS